MEITLFDDVIATSFTPLSLSWSELVEKCKAPHSYQSKRDMPLIKLAQFGDKRSASGSLRHDANVLRVSGIEGDYDAGLISASEAAFRLEMYGISGIIYTTPSHTLNAPRWRVLVPLSKDYPPNDRREFTAALNTALSGVLAPESFTLSQTYYFGAVAGAPYECFAVDGLPIDLVPGLPTAYLDSSKTTVKPRQDASAVDEVTLIELRQALDYVNADDRDTWVRIGQGLRCLGEVGFELWDTWSKTSPKYNAQDMPGRWGGFTGERTGYQAVFAKAQVAGWINPRSLNTAMIFRDSVNVASSKPAVFDREKIYGLQRSLGVEKSFGRENLSKHLHNVHNVHNVHTLPTEETINDAVKIIESTLPVCKSEPEKLFSSEFIEAVRVIRHDDGLWAKYRVELKQAKPSGVRLSDIDAATAPYNESNIGNDSVASELIELVLESGSLFFDDDADKPYFDGDINGIRTTLAIESKSFTEWLSFAFYTKTKLESAGCVGLSASEASLKQARFALCGIARHDGEKQRVYLRVASVAIDHHFLFLADAPLRAIEITSTGWQVRSDYPVKFAKTANMKSLPMPVNGGDISLLWQYVNITDSDRILVLAWVLECYRSETPNPVLQLSGGQGCAKSSSQNRLRELIDNNAVNLRGAPKAVEDVFVSSAHNWLVSFENMSNMSPQMQDALCVLATGGGFATRSLYTNTDETVINTKRPVIINGISHVITAQDLTDRSIQIELQRVDYIEESVIAEKWAQDVPLIFGGILDLFVKTLAQLPNVKLDRPPRMADFTKLGEAMCLALGHGQGYFSTIYNANRTDSIGKALESSPAAVAIRDMVAQHPGESNIVFAGTIQMLLNRLETFKHDHNAWPRSARGLGDVLRRQAPALHALGVSIEIGRPGRNGVPVTIKLV